MFFIIASSFFLKDSTQATRQLSNPKNQRRKAYYHEPILEIQWLCTENLTSKLHNRNLSNQNDCHDKEQPIATVQMTKGRFTTTNSFYVKQIPKLHHDKDGEENRHLIRGEEVFLFRREAPTKLIRMEIEQDSEKSQTEKDTSYQNYH